jgi:hypothetical protein
VLCGTTTTLAISHPCPCRQIQGRFCLSHTWSDVGTYQACCGVPACRQRQVWFHRTESERHSYTSTFAFTARGRALLPQANLQSTRSSARFLPTRVAACLLSLASLCSRFTRIAVAACASIIQMKGVTRSLKFRQVCGKFLTTIREVGTIYTM